MQTGLSSLGDAQSSRYCSNMVRITLTSRWIGIGLMLLCLGISGGCCCADKVGKPPLPSALCIDRLPPCPTVCGPCYGYHPTCWMAWSDCCRTCPPPEQVVPTSSRRGRRYSARRRRSLARGRRGSGARAPRRTAAYRSVHEPPKPKNLRRQKNLRTGRRGLNRKPKNRARQKNLCPKSKSLPRQTKLSSKSKTCAKRKNLCLKSKNRPRQKNRRPKQKSRCPTLKSLPRSKDPLSKAEERRPSCPSNLRWTIRGAMARKAPTGERPRCPSLMQGAWLPDKEDMSTSCRLHGRRNAGQDSHRRF